MLYIYSAALNEYVWSVTLESARRNGGAGRDSEDRKGKLCKVRERRVVSAKCEV